jgi:hypothetical protein
MPTCPIDTAAPDERAPVLLNALQRLGHAGAVALARLVADDDADFDGAARWIEEIAAGGLQG